jgi:predicted nucleic acid-binding protein
VLAGTFFVDTNLLLYWVDSADLSKRAISDQWVKALWAHGAGRISWQVLNEFYFNAIRKLKLPTRDLRAIVEAHAQWEPVGFGLGVIHRAWHWADKAGLPYWDGLILAAAETAGCGYLLSEDFQTGRKFGSMQVINPFHEQPGKYGLE